MKALENQMYLIAYIIVNVFGVILFISSWKWPRFARVLFAIMFAWACWLNFTLAFRSPQIYLDFDELTVLDLYKTFITGWFSQHIRLFVALIAASQGLIALSLILKGWLYRVGLIGGIVFFASLAPFGVGSAFPFTIILAVALIKLWKQDSVVWRSDKLHHIRAHEHMLVQE